VGFDGDRASLRPAIDRTKELVWISRELVAASRRKTSVDERRRRLRDVIVALVGARRRGARCRLAGWPVQISLVLASSRATLARALDTAKEGRMTLKYGFVKCTVAGGVRMKASRRAHETQYHLHANLNVPDGGGSSVWDVAVNVGTNDADDLLRYRLVFDFHHELTKTLAAAADGLRDLTGADALPALDFLRSDLLAETGRWRDSDVMDGGTDREPYRSLARLLENALDRAWPVYVFGRLYTEGGDGIHDIHMNQGSSGSFVHREGDDSNDHNDVWQDGAVIVDMGDAGWTGYFTAFTQQVVPTDALGNPADGERHEIGDADAGSLA
jgi:uncharacterized protein YukJ